MNGDRIFVRLLNRVIGTADATEMIDATTMAIHGFEPCENYKLPSGCCSVEFESGSFCSFDDDGNVIESVEFLTALIAGEKC